MIERQEIGKTLCVAVILPQRVLEAVLLSEQNLGPMRIGLTAEDPSSHVLCLDHEDAKFGHNNMIDLRGAVFGGKDDVAKKLVGIAVQKQPHAE